MAQRYLNPFQAIADLNLWYKIEANDPLYLSDLQKLLPLRWTYFRDNWSFIKETAIQQIPTYSDPNSLKLQIESLTEFINTQLNAKNNPFSNSDVLFQFYSVFDVMPIDSIPISLDERKIIDNEINRVSIFTKEDFINIRNAIAKGRDLLADQVGTSDPDYNRIYNRSPIAQTLNVNITHVNQMLVYQNAINNVNFILANTKELGNSSFVDPFAVARINANNPEINVGQYSSGTLVKLNYGDSLEDLALRHLGDANKWLDIAIANGLKPPYIDEIGETIALISNGEGNQINIAKTDISGNLNKNKIFINQVVLISSNTYPNQTQRVIKNIKEIPISGELVLELDGESDLNNYTLAANAKIRIFKANTVNSNFYVLIPSQEVITSPNNEVPWFLLTKAEDERRALIELTLSKTNDLVLDSTGDFQLSYGLNNAIQAIKLKLEIELGSLKRHPSYGLINVIGLKNSDTDTIKQQIVDSISKNISNDSRFERLENLSVNYSTANGPSLFNVRMGVRLAGGGNSVIPISFSVNFNKL